jgi:hypothetical protein
MLYVRNIILQPLYAKQYEKCLIGLGKIQALSLVKECYSMKLDLLTKLLHDLYLIINCGDKAYKISKELKV